MKPVVKNFDQSCKQDLGKMRYTLIPMRILDALATVRQYGNNKYGDSESWRQVEFSRYNDAMLRHIIAYLKDPTGVDKESGYPHLWHAATNIAFLIEREEEYLK